MTETKARTKTKAPATDHQTKASPSQDHSLFYFPGMHLGEKTKQSNPYDWDPMVVFSIGGKANGSCYSDRLRLWYSPEKLSQKMIAHFGDDRDSYTGRSISKIQQFLRDLMDKPELKLLAIEEHCNASGFSVWYFKWNDGTDSQEALEGLEGELQLP